jgi:uncharacterized damage-inducible protein DinB
MGLVRFPIAKGLDSSTLVTYGGGRPMHDDFESLYDYNRWANRRILAACRALTAEQYAAEPAPGWSSIRSSLVHIAVATEGWLRGLAGEPIDDFPTEAQMPTVGDAERLLDRADEIVRTLLPSASADWLATPRTVQGRGRSVTLPPWVVLRHLVNHATYHRGQVAAKLKRLGVDPPPTDLVFWAFEKMPQTA